MISAAGVRLPAFCKRDIDDMDDAGNTHFVCAAHNGNKLGFRDKTQVKFVAVVFEKASFTVIAS